jgi:hypothetical protein
MWDAAQFSSDGIPARSITSGFHSDLLERHRILNLIDACDMGERGGVDTGLDIARTLAADRGAGPLEEGDYGRLVRELLVMRPKAPKASLSLSLSEYYVQFSPLAVRTAPRSPWNGLVSTTMIIG